MTSEGRWWVYFLDCTKGWRCRCEADSECAL